MWHLPDLFEHFEACGVQTNLFATSWFMTLLSDGGILPDQEVRKGGRFMGAGLTVCLPWAGRQNHNHQTKGSHYEESVLVSCDAHLCNRLAERVATWFCCWSNTLQPN